MSKELLVSVVLPVYNGESFIAHAIRSIESQSYTNHEIIVIDDGSTDNTLSVLEGFRDTIRLIKHDRNLGGNVARNNGIRAAKGGIIAFMDSDDIWHKDKLKIYMELLTSHASVLFAFSDFNRFEWKNREYYSLSNSQIFPVIYDVIKNEKYYKHKAFVIPKEKVFSMLLSGYPTFSSTIVIKKCIFDKIELWDESLKRNQDYDFSLRCASVTDFLYIDERLTDIGRHNANVSKNIVLQHDGDVSVMKKHLSYVWYNDEQKYLIKKYIGKRLAGKGYNLFHSGDVKKSLKMYMEATRYPGMLIRATTRIFYILTTSIIYPDRWK